jgi:hypothetical protein
MGCELETAAPPALGKEFIMKRKLVRYFFVFIFLSAQIASFTRVAAAQAAQAELTGEVHDQTGAALASARLSLTSVETKRVITTTSGDSGIYLFTNVPPRQLHDYGRGNWVQEVRTGRSSALDR